MTSSHSERKLRSAVRGAGGQDEEMTSPLALGVHVGQQNATMEELIALWQRLDGTVDWISVWDHLYEAPPTGGTTPHFEAIATLGALASVTSRARLGCLMFCVPYRNPALLAKACVAIDHIAGTVRAGLRRRLARTRVPRPRLRFPRHIDPLRHVDRRPRDHQLDAHHHRPHDIHGRSLPHRGRHLRPGTLRRTDPAVDRRQRIERTPQNAARFCSGWNVPYVGPAEFRMLNDRIDHACEAIGRDPATLERSINLAFHIGATPADADAELERIRTQWGPELTERLTAGALTGTPDQALDRIAEYRAAGADLVNIALRLPVNTDALDAYLTETVPAARAIS